jgi:hypothetical protein
MPDPTPWKLYRPHTNRARMPTLGTATTRVSRDWANVKKTFSHNPLRSRLPRTEVDTVPHVAIIGGGFAGLRCADVLIQHNVKVTIFEARDRIGGRAHQIESGGHLIDLGPNWIHGSKDNPIFQIASRITTLERVEEPGAVFDGNGSQLKPEIAEWLSETMWQVVLDAFTYSDKNSQIIGSGQSLMKFFEAQIAALSPPKYATENWAELQALLMEMARTWGTYVGDSVESQSLKFFYLEDCLDAETPFVANTYRDIVKEVSKFAVARAEILFNEEVVSIQTNEPHQRPAVTIRTAKGTTATFNQVVVTCPLGWLKHHHESLFSPPIRPRLSLAIKNLNFGRLEKIYVTFPSAFWYSPDSPKVFDFLTPSYLPSSIPNSAKSSSTQSVISLAHLPAPYNQPTLLFYLYGPYATAMVYAITPYTHGSFEYTKALLPYTQPFFSLLPNYNSLSPACVPTAIYGTQWQNDDLAGNGSYTNFQIGLDEGDMDILCLRDGMPERGIWFAGEHTAPFFAVGTTTGAYWAGEQVARRILSLENL